MLESRWDSQREHGEVGGASSRAGFGLLILLTTDYADCTDGNCFIRVIREIRGCISGGGVGGDVLSKKLKAGKLMAGKCRCALFHFPVINIPVSPSSYGHFASFTVSRFLETGATPVLLAADFFAMCEMNLSSSCLDQSCTHTGRWRGISDLKSPRLDQ